MRIYCFLFYLILTTTLTFKSVDLQAQDSLTTLARQDGYWLIEDIPLSKVLNLLATHYRIIFLNPENIDTTVLMSGKLQDPIESLMRQLAVNYKFDFEMNQDTIKLKKLNPALSIPEWRFYDNPLDEIIQELANSYNYRLKFIYRPKTRVHFMFPMEAGIDDVLAQLALLGVNFKLTFKIINLDQNRVHVDRIITVKKGRRRKALFFPIAGTGTPKSGS